MTDISPKVATPANNPLLDFSGLLHSVDIRPEHITPAVDVLLERAASVVAQVKDPAAPASWDTVVIALEDATEPLGRAWGIVSHLSAVAGTPELRKAHAANLPCVIEFWSGLGQDLELFEKYKAIADSAEYVTLSSAHKKLLENELCGFRLGGAKLPEDQKPRFAAIQEQQAQLTKAFSDHVLDATSVYALAIGGEARFAGLPDDAKQAVQEATRRDNPDATGWEFLLHFPSYFPVLQYADDRVLHRTPYEANATRASELGAQYGGGKTEWDNTANMAEQFTLRTEEAHMLGYHSFGEVPLVPKMADSPEDALRFLEELANRARPFAEKDWGELQAFTKTALSIDKLEPWDIAYVSEKLREARYVFSEQEVKQYFPEPAVLDGLFNVVQTLFSAKILPEAAEIWHPSVRFFRVESAQGELLTQFYIDLYAREGKRGSAWTGGAHGRKLPGDASV